MALVQQVRVLRNVVWVGILCLLALVLVRARLWEHREALGLGWGAGGLCGWLRWGQLRRKIVRRDRRYERNKKQNLENLRRNHYAPRRRGSLRVP
jgi:hypothetical protein